MFGKFFASAFSGSMVGAGPVVFAVWGYVIAYCVRGSVELNPRLLAMIIGCSVEEIQKAIDFLCQPDPNSRSTDEEGRRLIKEGQFQFRVVNHAKYNQIRSEDERREYNRRKKHEERDRKKCQNVKKCQTMSMTVNDTSAKSNMSAHTESNTDAEAEAEKSSFVSPNPKEQSRGDTRARDDVNLNRNEEAAIPTVVEIKQFCQGPAGIPDKYAENYHEISSIQHRWIKCGRLIDWRKDIVRWWAKDRQNFTRNYVEFKQPDHSKGF